jgi:hypothetical protein
MAGEILAVRRSFPAIREDRRRCTLLHWNDHSIHPGGPVREVLDDRVAEREERPRRDHPDGLVSL